MHLAALAAIRGDTHEQTELTQAAAIVRAHGIESDAALGPLIEQPPPGAATHVVDRLRVMHETGAWILVESAIADLPADLRWLYESEAVTIPQLGTMHAALGVTSAADLAEAVRTHAIQRLPGCDAEVERAVAAALPGLRARTPRLGLGRAVAIGERVLAPLRTMPGVAWASAAGSLRRGDDTVGDVELVAAAADPTRAVGDLATLPAVSRVLHRGARRIYLRFDRTQVGVRLADPAQAGAMLLHLTGSAAHVAALRARAARLGRRLEPAGLVGSGGGPAIGATEEEIYAALGLPFIPPEIRAGGDEIVLAGHGALPVLVTRADIRGDLHMHTTWSDGRHSVEEMALACRALGYEYIAITDHSPTSAASRRLTAADVARQAEEIARVRALVPDMIILHGCEVDILPGGALDFPDRILSRFDIVLASLHERAGQSGEQLLRRYLSAMKHPLVSLLTHPANRLVPKRPGYDLDWDRLFEAAAQTHTLLEIDGAPGHLDLSGELAGRAVAAGVLVSIDSDSHRAELLERQMTLGVTMARRGRLEARHVANTRPVAELVQLLARKRSG
ncbi:MAG: PHP domain-containing protein [Acidobacteria bacterium]|nr:PHP domain-containing protein [Acidobacteriota bacterium]